MRQAILMLTLCLPAAAGARMISGEPLTHTFSIVACDPNSGQMGVAVQSHWFSVGSIVAWAEAGVGAVATQSLVNVSFGPRGLDLLRAGRSPQEALNELTESDEGRDFRQLALIDPNGSVAAFTGSKCIADAGHIVGKNYSVQANMMLNQDIVPAMAKAFEASSGPLAERMLAALEAAQAAGGDIRGQQSAAIVIVRTRSTGKPWEDRLIDLRVEDHPNAVAELARVLKVFRAYEHMNQGDLAIEKGDVTRALREYGAAERMFPTNTEMRFWHAVALANVGRLDLALPIFKTVFAADANYIELTRRIVPNGLLKADGATLEKILRTE
ncbi:MAG: DUF1028 domain-containing protein [Sedimentisphaerales bacterium]|nr:DUF1028 domain-containing protein [Sedimentisphaerales bacterium]